LHIEHVFESHSLVPDPLVRTVSAAETYVSARPENDGSTKLSAKSEMQSRGEDEDAKVSERASHASVPVGSKRV
jgi:hypothetical protein